ncbi:MAG: adenine-specific methyltransferase EcoRI family protein [Bacilli bacterium]
MSKNSKGINDEFYTPAESIINELKWYGYDGEFKGKTIYLPCDYDATLPYLKKEIKNIKSVDGFLEFNDEVTIYKVMPELFTEEDKKNTPRNCQFVAYLTEHKSDFGIKDIFISGYDALTGMGLRFQDAPFEQFDIIITNPPFSQMNEWINKIIDFEKKGGQFIFLAPLSILTNTFTFPHFKNLDFWCGYTEPSKYEDTNGNFVPQYLPSVWLTNFDVKKHKPKRVLSKSWKHHPDEYMPFWNYKAINVQGVNDIPYDYAGEFAVPATMLKDLHLDQFEIVGLGVGKEQFQALPGWINRSYWTFKDYLKYADTPKTTHSFDVSSVLITTKDLIHPYKQPFAKVILKNKELIKDRVYFSYEDVVEFVKTELKVKNPDDIWNPKLYKSRGNKTAKQGKGGIKE